MRLLNIFISFAIILFSCSKQENSTISDTIYLRNNGADMPAYIYGNNSKKVFIILLHGGPGDSGLSYRTGKYAKLLEDEYVMVYWDQRGQGMSQGHFPEETMNINQMTEDLYKLILLIKHKYGNNISVFLMGHSWGGTLGTNYMINDTYENEVNGWIEVDGAHDIPKGNIEIVKMLIEIGNQQINQNNSVNEWEAIVNYAEDLDTNNLTLNDGFELNYLAFEAEDLLWYDYVINDYNNEGISWGNILLFSPLNPITSIFTGLHTNNITLNEVENCSLTDQLYKIDKPSLFIWGKYDFVVPPSLGHDAYNLSSTPNNEKELIIFKKSGHSPMDNQPNKFVNEVSAFIETYKN